MSEQNQTPINPNLRTVIAPERSAGVSENAPEPGKAPEKKKSKRALYTAIGSVAGLAVAAGAVFGGIVLNQAPKTEPIASAPSDPTETAPPTPEATNSPEQELTVEALQVPAGLSAEALGEMVVGDRFTAWANAGADDNLRLRAREANVGWPAFLPEVADENAAIFAEALYIDGWEQDPNLVKDVNGAKEINRATLDSYKSTAWNRDEHPENVEPYRYWMNVVEVAQLSASGDERTLEVALRDHDNSDKNMIESQLSDHTFIYTIRFKAVDGFEKIVGISIR